MTDVAGRIWPVSGPHVATQRATVPVVTRAVNGLHDMIVQR
jgi:hypothetical protein